MQMSMFIQCVNSKVKRSKRLASGQKKDRQKKLAELARLERSRVLLERNLRKLQRDLGDEPGRD